SPPSAACVPATHLTSVDFPAPLSPTSAITSPRRTSKSTSVSAWTDPNDFVMLRSWRSGVPLSVISGDSKPKTNRWRRQIRRLQPVISCFRLAVLLEVADADLALLQEALGEELRVVGLRD